MKMLFLHEIFQLVRSNKDLLMPRDCFYSLRYVCLLKAFFILATGFPERVKKWER